MSSILGDGNSSFPNITGGETAIFDDLYAEYLSSVNGIIMEDNGSSATEYQQTKIYRAVNDDMIFNTNSIDKKFIFQHGDLPANPFLPFLTLSPVDYSITLRDGAGIQQEITVNELVNLQNSTSNIQDQIDNINAPSSKYYAELYSYQDQPMTVADTLYAITLPETNQVGFQPIGGTSKYRVLNEGTYKIQYSARVNKFTGTGTSATKIFLQVNNADYPGTTNSAETNANLRQMNMTDEWIINFNTDDLFEFFMVSDTTGVRLETKVATTTPYSSPAQASISVSVSFITYYTSNSAVVSALQTQVDTNTTDIIGITDVLTPLVASFYDLIAYTNGLTQTVMDLSGVVDLQQVDITTMNSSINVLDSQVSVLTSTTNTLSPIVYLTQQNTTGITYDTLTKYTYFGYANNLEPTKVIIESNLGLSVSTTLDVGVHIREAGETLFDKYTPRGLCYTKTESDNLYATLAGLGTTAAAVAVNTAGMALYITGIAPPNLIPVTFGGLFGLNNAFPLLSAYTLALNATVSGQGTSIASLESKTMYQSVQINETLFSGKLTCSYGATGLSLDAGLNKLSSFAGQNLTVSSSNTLTLDAGTVDINTTGDINLQPSGSTKINGTLKVNTITPKTGTTININSGAVSGTVNIGNALDNITLNGIPISLLFFSQW